MVESFLHSLKHAAANSVPVSPRASVEKKLKTGSLIQGPSFIRHKGVMQRRLPHVDLMEEEPLSPLVSRITKASHAPKRKDLIDPALKKKKRPRVTTRPPSVEKTSKFVIPELYMPSIYANNSMGRN